MTRCFFQLDGAMNFLNNGSPIKIHIYKYVKKRIYNKGKVHGEKY